MLSRSNCRGLNVTQNHVVPFLASCNVQHVLMCEISKLKTLPSYKECMHGSRKFSPGGGGGFQWISGNFNVKLITLISRVGPQLSSGTGCFAPKSVSRWDDSHIFCFAMRWFKFRLLEENTLKYSLLNFNRSWKKRKSTLTLKIYNRNNHAFKNYTLYEC